MINTLFSTGRSALNASQAWINVTGNNIANVDTEAYSRQYVEQKDRYAVSYNPGELGLGVNASQVLRYYDDFLERSYIRQNTVSARWDEQDKLMASIETQFNESNRTGINSVLSEFFQAWNDLALYPDSTAHRESLISYSNNLVDMLNSTTQQLRKIQAEMDFSIQEGVKRVNQIIQTIADINRNITANTVDNINNPNSLYDERDRLVRELSSLVDIDVIDHGKGAYIVQLSTGQPLVDGTKTFEMRFMDGITEKSLVTGSNYTGDIIAEGSDGFEYTVEITDDGAGGGNPSHFRVSLDGGRTWLKDQNGTEMRFDLVDDGNGVSIPHKVKNLEISFTDMNNLALGDSFNVVPKQGLYWIEPTKGPQNVTPQVLLDGTDNNRRVTGGQLTSWFNIRDDNTTRYLDELNAFAKSLIWEVNRQHSQGAGLYAHSTLEGTEGVPSTTEPLDSFMSRTGFSDRLSSGDIRFHIYDEKTGKYQESIALRYNSGESLEDVFNKINALQDNNGDPLFQAVINDGKLTINILPDANGQLRNFHIGEDSSGLMATLGLNTFFSGNSAENIALNIMVGANPSKIASSQVNGNHEVNVGDPITAQNIGKLSRSNVMITTTWKTTDKQSLNEYYANLVTNVGSDRRLSKTNSEYHDTLTQELFERTEAVSGVNLDEEMTNLVKFQHSYTAAAKLITTADEMLQTLLGIKQ